MKILVVEDLEALVNNMQEIDSIFQEIAKVNKLYFESKINKKEYFDTLKPIYEKLKQAIKKAKCLS